MTTLLTQPHELMPPTALKMLIYGQPGSGKTTLALSAPNPALIDFDNGIHRVEPRYRRPTLQVRDYQQVLDLLNGKELDPFDSICVDTLGKLVERICDHVGKHDAKARQADGNMTQKGWGQVKSTFQNFVKLVNSKGKHLIIVAHEGEEKNGDNTVKRHDCAGSARKDIVKELDLMGYVEMMGKKRTIGFHPTDQYYAKNALGIVDVIEIPDTTHENAFITKQVLPLSVARLADQNELLVQYQARVKEIDAELAALTNAEQVNAYYATIEEAPRVWDSFFVNRRKLADRCKIIGVEFDKDKKLFFDKPKETAAKTAETAPAGQAAAQ